MGWKKNSSAFKNALYPARPQILQKKDCLIFIQSNRELEGMKTLDLFGGTGSISFELASRGAADLTIVEKDIQMLAFIRKTAETLGLTQLNGSSDVFRFLKAIPRTNTILFLRARLMRWKPSTRFPNLL